MGEVSTVGLDIAKSIFQAHGAAGAGGVVFRKKLGRGRLLAFFASLPPCLVAMEACAGAICEAAQRPTMRFVPVKSQAQQASGVVFRARDLLVRQRTQITNAIRGHLAEYGRSANACAQR